MTQTLFTNARIFDGESAECAEGMFLLVDGERIVEISGKPIAAAAARVIDVGGRTLMPGLIDAHVHAFFSDTSVAKMEAMGETYRAAHAVRMLSHALKCGFTTVRDVGGGNYSLYKAMQDRLFAGPRFFYAGRVLTMTGGHGDMRTIEHRPGYESGGCSCSCGAESNAIGVVADGVDECLKAVREQFRQGAHCIKIMGSGGVMSPTDPMWMNQYREDEIRAIVNEAEERRSYVTAHCHPASAIRRSVEFGVRCIEHGTAIDADTAAFVAKRGAYVIPTIVIIEALVGTGRETGLPSTSQEKVDYAWTMAMKGLDHMRTAGVKLGFGTDLLGNLFDKQCREFTLRSEVFTPVEILRQATSMNAEAMMLKGEIGCVAVGACADLLVVDGDPLKDIELLAANGAALRVVMRNGELVRNEL